VHEDFLAVGFVFDPDIEGGLLNLKNLKWIDRRAHETASLDFDPGL
jgi:hypothetical protein